MRTTLPTVYTFSLDDGTIVFTADTTWPASVPGWTVRRSATVPPTEGPGGQVDDAVRWVAGVDADEPALVQGKPER